MATSVPRFRAPRDGFSPAIRNLWRLLPVAIGILLAACAGGAGGEEPIVRSAPLPTVANAKPDTDTGSSQPETESDAAVSTDEGPALQTATRPDWLGTRVLPTIPGGAVTPQTTPAELEDRRFPTVDALSNPAGDQFAATIEPVPAQVLARSTWNDGCPVQPDELSYLTMSFWGFDGLVHTGEMIVHRDVATDITTVFADLFESRFPIEQMTVVTTAELNAAPTGDGNNTTAFVCRPVTGGSSFSQHAYGLAVDLNPFHNPYIRGDLVLPELAVSYLDRDQRRTGMVVAGGPAVQAFEGVGWGWGGQWRSLKDYQHFSLNDR